MAKAQDADSVYCEAFNFGPNEDGLITVGAMAKKLSQYFPAAEVEVVTAQKSVKETGILKISSKKAKEVLGWKPKYTIDDTLRMAAEFAIREQQGEPVRKICMEYIQTYLD